MKTSPATDTTGDRQPWWHFIDVVLVLLVAAPALALGAPTLGYVIGAAGWVLYRVVGAIDRRWIVRVDEPLKQLGVRLFEAFGRIWLLAGVIIAAALLGGHEDGLTASLVILGAYSVEFGIKVLTRPRKNVEDA